MERQNMTNKFSAKLSVVIMLVISIAITLKITTVSKNELAETASSEVTEVIIFDAELPQVESSTVCEIGIFREWINIGRLSEGCCICSTK